MAMKDVDPLTTSIVADWIKRVVEDERKRDAVRTSEAETAARRADLVRLNGRRRVERANNEPGRRFFMSHDSPEHLLVPYSVFLERRERLATLAAALRVCEDPVRPPTPGIDETPDDGRMPPSAGLATVAVRVRTSE